MHDIQLSLHVEAHPELKEHTDGGVLTSTLKIPVTVPIGRDLQPGDKLAITIGDADGTVLATTTAEVATVGFVPIKDRDLIIGTERVQKAKLSS